MKTTITIIMFFLTSICITFAQDSTHLKQIVPDFQVNENTGSGGAIQIEPVLASDSAGNYVVAWGDNRNGNYNIFAQRFTSDGTKIGNNFRVNVNDFGDHNYPAIAMSSSGKFVIVWTEFTNNSSSCCGQLYNNQGEKINGNFYLAVNESADQVFPKAEMDSIGNFIIVWEEHEKASYLGCYGQLFSSNGEKKGDTFFKEVKYNSSQFWDLSMNNHGEFAISWVQDTSLYIQEYLSNGQQKGEKLSLNNRTESFTDPILPRIVLESSGNIVVVWTINNWLSGISKIYAQYITSDGNLSRDTFMINNDTLSYCWFPDILFDSHGNINILWGTGGPASGESFKYFLQTISKEWIIQSHNIMFVEIPVNQGWITHSTISNNKFVSVFDTDNYPDDNDLIIQYFSLEGKLVRDSIYFVEDNGSNDQTKPCITVDNEGNSIIAWMDQRNGNSQIYFQRISSDGTLIGNNVKVDDSTGYQPQVTVDGEGNFTIFWLDEIYSGYIGSIYCKRYSKNGIPIGDKVKLINGINDYYNVAMSETGKFVIAWSDGITHCQRFNSDGAKVGEKILIEDVIKYGNFYAEVSINKNDDFVVLWDDSRNIVGGGPTDIYGQRFTWKAGKLGENFRVTNSDELFFGGFNEISNIALTMDDNGMIRIFYLTNSETALRGYKIDFNDVSKKESITIHTSNSIEYLTSVLSNNLEDFLILCDEYTETNSIKTGMYFMMQDGNSFSEELKPFSSEVQNGSNLNRDFYFFKNKIYLAFEDFRGLNTGIDIWANVWKIDYPTSIAEESSIPTEFTLSQNYPNPFNPTTTIKYSIPSTSNPLLGGARGGLINVQLKVFDILGREIAVLVDEKQKPGYYEVKWDASNQPSGVYFYRISTGGYVETNKMVLLR